MSFSVPIGNRCNVSQRRPDPASADPPGSAICMPDVIANDWHERQSAFAAAVLDPGLPVPSGITGPDGACSARRFAVYRNNVVSGLIEVLKAAYPVTVRIVGEEFFAAMARLYIARELPRSPIMLDYGAGFVDFIVTFQPAAAIAYLPDVVKLERAWLEAYHETEALPVDPASLLGVGPERLSHAVFAFHPSMRIVRSSFSIFTLWQMHVQDCMPAATALERGGEDVLIVRPGAEVDVRRLSAGAASFIQALAARMRLTEAASTTLGEHPGFDLAGALTGLLASGMITGWSLREDVPAPITGRLACAL